MFDPVTAPLLWPVFYEIIKVWLPLGAAGWGVFKIVNWVKNSLVGIKSSIDVGNTNLLDLKGELKSQTGTFVAELKEFRQDFRAFYGPAVLANSLQRTKRAGVRAKKNPPTKAAAKKGI